MFENQYHCCCECFPSYFAFALRILSVSCLAMWPNIWECLCKPITKYKILDTRPWHQDTKYQIDTKSEIQISLPSDIDVASVSQNKPGGGIWGKQNSFPPNWWISSLSPLNWWISSVSFEGYSDSFRVKIENAMSDILSKYLCGRIVVGNVCSFAVRGQKCKYWNWGFQ